MDWFNREVQSIENEAKHFIDESFKKLRSAEGAFDMLHNFKHIRSVREKISLLKILAICRFGDNPETDLRSITRELMISLPHSQISRSDQRPNDDEV